ncbi:hypothetical protein GYW75_02245 [Gilliamella sp. ESL0232]|uniref:hypothetical protein n=1 Tax=Gilliamella sp. ESL0232 TaxID=2705037 RepID=UPI001580B626|nr:hypothetical protein [Gilliamella sp. ESL0232]NUE95213.1 hypothetical protein [Gilliamella sp. ESL0232]
MKNLCIILIVFITSINFSNAKIQDYNPNGKEEYIFDENNANAIANNGYMDLNKSTKPKSSVKLPYDKYKGMRSYIQKEIKGDPWIYYQLHLQNGENYYIWQLPSESEKVGGSLNRFITKYEVYKNLKGKISEISNIKLSNTIKVDKVLTEGDKIFSVVLSNGAKYFGNSLEDAQMLLSKITDENDKDEVLNILNTDDIFLSYDKIENTFFLTMDVNSPPISMFVKIIDGKELLLITRVLYTGKDWLFSKKFLIYQNDKKFIKSNIDFNREVKYGVKEYYHFKANNNYVDYIKSLTDTDDTLIRFYGENSYSDKTVDSKKINRMKKVIRLYEILEKYYK